MHVKFVLKSAAKRLKYSDSISSFRQNHLSCFRQNHLCEENHPPYQQCLSVFFHLFLSSFVLFFFPTHSFVHILFICLFLSFVCLCVRLFFIWFEISLIFFLFVYFFVYSFVWLFFLFFFCLFTIFYHARSSINTAIWNPIKKYYRINCHIL